MAGSDMTCEVCGNVYDKAFTVTRHDGVSGVFDSLECAANWIAPRCAACHVTILGHGVESAHGIFCCARCASRAGDDRLTDRVDAPPEPTHASDSTSASS